MPPEDPLLVRRPWRRLPRAEVRAFLEEVSGRLARGRTVVCLITDDRELRQLNRRFLGKDRATDVLSFPAAEDANGAGGAALGEIAISIERAERQAAGLGHSLADELRILVLHGVLHLAGFDHENDSGEMARAETRWRKRLGLPMGLIERSVPTTIEESRVNRPRRVRVEKASARGERTGARGERRKA
jgi:probable rRNA maturation factor